KTGPVPPAIGKPQKHRVSCRREETSAECCYRSNLYLSKTKTVCQESVADSSSPRNNKLERTCKTRAITEAWSYCYFYPHSVCIVASYMPFISYFLLKNPSACRQLP